MTIPFPTQNSALNTQPSKLVPQTDREYRQQHRDDEEADDSADGEHEYGFEQGEHHFDAVAVLLGVEFREAFEGKGQVGALFAQCHGVDEVVGDLPFFDILSQITGVNK